MRRSKIVLSLLLAGMGTAATAQNINLPIIQTKYTADPAPYVHNDTVYLYTTHDEDGAEGFLMKDWLLYTSTDMVNWQDRGAVASLKDFKWFKGENGAWAEQVIERNGKVYVLPYPRSWHRSAGSRQSIRTVQGSSRKASGMGG